MTKKPTNMLDPTGRAAQCMASAVPAWRDVVRAEEALGLTQYELLHAGPPLASPQDHCAPILNAACAALLFEGLARSAEQARQMILAGEVTLTPAQDRGVVTPLAAVVSSSMWLHRVIDVDHPSTVAYAPLNEGGGPAQRFGVLTPTVIERLAWVHKTLGPALHALGTLDIGLCDLAHRSLAMGDELHARVGVGSALMAEQLSARGLAGDAQAFLDSNTQSFLNPWMAACKAMMIAAAKTRGGDLLVAAGGNGVTFGIQRCVSYGHWVSQPAETPQGPALSTETATIPRLPAIGDSAVIDAVGLGALALDAAPEQAALLDKERVARMRAAEALLVVYHPGLERLIGLDAARVTRQLCPGVCLAALDRTGQYGLVARGLAYHPLALYEA